MHLGTEEKITVGTPDTVIDSTAAGEERSVIFEDDGTTGYFYAVRPGVELEILDALHVYDVADVADRHIPVKVQLVWDETWTAAVLLINGYDTRCMIFSGQLVFAAMPFRRLPTGNF